MRFSRRLYYVGGLCLLAALVVWALITAGRSGEGEFFMPHAHCYLFNSRLMLLHGGSDLLIGIAYLAISATLVYLVLRARRELPFHWMMLAFAVFIVACGATHFMEVWTLRAANPPYWFSGEVKLLTAVASLITAALLPPLLPRILALLEAARLSHEHRDNLEAAHLQLGALYAKITELDALKTSFFANISHELRTPLSLIIGPVDRLLETARLGADERRELTVVRSNAVMLHKHVNDLLDLSKLEAGKLEMDYAQVDLGRLSRLMVALFGSVADQRHIEVIVETPPELPAEVDREKIQRVLINLLSNAFKFVPEGGVVRLALSGKDGRAILSVGDSGPGVAPELRTTIFERFNQGDSVMRQRYGGTGLGLSIVKEFVELHGGTIGVDASLPGAVFVVEVPLRAPADTVVSQAPAADTDPLPGAGLNVQESEKVWAQLQSGRWSELPPQAPSGQDRSLPLVLVVEDNREMNDFVSRLLAGEFRTLSAYDGYQGLALARECLPDLIISDVMMPQMNGSELIAALRSSAELAGVPVILLTAKTDEVFKAGMLVGGAQDYVTKPFDSSELLARVRNHVVAKLTRDTLQHELASNDHDLASLAREVTGKARLLEAAKEAAEKANRAKDQFLAVLSHELRTPLTPALAAAIELEESEAFEPQQLRRSLSVIRRNIELEARLVDDLLDLTRISRGKLELHLADNNVHDLLLSALEMCAGEAAQKRIVIHKEFHAARLRVSADGPRLLQVFWNLLLNAVKFTPEGGGITVRTSDLDNGRLRLEVSDTGVGIAPEIMPRIFEAFEQGEKSITRRFGGLGLGLTVARALIEAHGGSIYAASAGLGLGTVMTVELPAGELSDSTAAPPPVTPGEAVSDIPFKILLVEDHQDTRETLERLLKRWGYLVEVAASIEQALALSSEAGFDLLISDLGLPDGHGTDLLKALHKTGPLRAIAMSGFGMEEDLLQSRQAGFSEHLVKPVGARQLRAAIEALRAGV